MALCLVDCLRALRPLCLALTPTQPKVLGAYLSLVDILIEDDVALVLQRMSPEDTHVLMTLVERGALSGQTRLASCALESIYVLAMHAADLQLQGGLYNPSLDAGKGVEALFVATPQGDSVQQVYVHLAQLATALLQKLPNEQMTPAEQDVIGACLFAALFCIGVRAFALRHLLRCFAANFAAQGAGSWSGGCSTHSLEQRIEELETAVLVAVREALPADAAATGAAAPAAPAAGAAAATNQGAPPRFRQQHFHKREDAFKLELANFVAEFATFAPSRGPST
ncbi:hypothetical protein EAH_00054950, partial [Eimeria acervulina]